MRQMPCFIRQVSITLRKNTKFRSTHIRQSHSLVPPSHNDNYAEDFAKQFMPPKKLKFCPEFPSEFPPTTLETIQNSAWIRAKSFRTGVVGQKLGMIGLWDGNGERHACTVVRLDNVEVVGIRVEPNKMGRYGLQVGYGSRKWTKVHRTQRAFYEKAGVNYKEKMMEFHVTEDALLPVGTELTVRHFVPGQKVDVQGISKGKGFQGVVKRWGFSLQPKSHGNTKARRRPGSIGIKGHARVHPGKKMPGRMGGKYATIKNLKIFKIDAKLNLLYIRGHIAGNKGGFLRIRDAIFKPHKDPPPFPTFFRDPNEEYLPIMYAPDAEMDPFIEEYEVSELATV